MKLFIIIYFVDDSGLMELNDVDFDDNVDETSTTADMTTVKIKEEM
jgi:hypothetical protein